MAKTTLSSIGYDSLTEEDVAAMQAYDKLCLLSAVATEIKRLSDLKNEAIDVRTDAEFLWIDSPSKENKKIFIKSKSTVQKLDAMIKARNRQHSSLQTAIRVTP